MNIHELSLRIKEKANVKELIQYHGLDQFKNRFGGSILDRIYLSDEDKNMSKEEATTIVEAWLLEHM